MDCAPFLESSMSDRTKRRLVNKLAQLMANEHYSVVRSRLQAQLDNAEMRGTDHALIASWQAEIGSQAPGRANVRTL